MSDTYGAEPTIEEPRSWRPKFLQYEKNVKKGEVSESIRSLGTMLMTSRGETGPLQTLAEQYKGTVLGSAYGRIYQEVQSGRTTMAQAFRDEQKVFPKIVGDLLNVGSRAGSSGAQLQKAADILDEGSDLAQKIRSAVMQPAILLFVIIAFLYAVILFVLPTFATMFKSFGKPLPPLSQGIIAAGNIIVWAGGAIALLVILWVVYYRVWGRHVWSLRVRISALILRMPAIGKVIQAQKMTQLFSILHGLLEVGMPEREALKIAAESVGNPAIQDHLDLHIVKMDRGAAGFSDMADGKLIPRMAGFMIRNGFDTGNELQALDDMARVYRRDGAKKAENLTQALEPISNGVVGVVFVAVLVACYLPVYDLFSTMIQV